MPFSRMILGAAALSLCASPAFAEGAPASLSERLSAKAKWTMSAPRGKPAPDCIETWTFGFDGALTVESGKERVQKQWRMGEGVDNSSLYMRRMSSTGGLDCLGTESEPFTEPQPEDSEPLWLLAFNTGDVILLCNPQYVVDDKTKKQTPFYDDQNCWGELKPAG